MHLRFSRASLLAIVFGFLLACQSDKNTEAEQVDLLSYRACFAITPVVKKHAIGDSIVFQVSQTDSSKVFDSIVFQIDDKKIDLKRGRLTDGVSLTWHATEAQTGSHIFSVSGFAKTTAAETSTQTFFLTSDVVPEIYTYEVVKSYPHDPQSFTQGLEWSGGQLFEGTGLNGKSAVMQVDPVSGKPAAKTPLPEEFFGEGITIVGNKLYQLTWQNKKGFVYQLPSLTKVSEFGYPTDGWGLTHMDNHLIMTDGSNQLFTLSLPDYRPIGKKEVWDNHRPVAELNELEAMGGAIYANKYTTDTIVKIDPKSGKVLAYIVLDNLLPAKDRTGNEDVLNGLAWSEDEKLWYVTGKNWPKMYAIRLVKKQAV